MELVQKPKQFRFQELESVAALLGVSTQELYAEAGLELCSSHTVFQRKG